MRSCVAILRDQDRRQAEPEPGGQTPARVEEEGTAVAAHQVERPPGEQHDLRRPPAFLFPGERPGDLGLAPAVDKQQVAGERRCAPAG